MAINSYTTLQAAVANWMNRGDLVAVVPDFISLAESRIATDLRVRRLLTTIQLSTVANGTVPLPAGWLEFEALRYNDRPIDLLTSEQIADRFGQGSGEPAYYTIEGDQLVLGPTPDGVYTLDARYYKQLDPLATTGANWLLTSKPNLYLYAALAEACLFVKKKDDAASWAGLYGGIVESLHVEDAKAKHSGSPLRVIPR
ncbi:hypothetical protein ABL840_05030 [Variovorax sp. NFACC27]|uniref:phage adaptor protein n=1 Tax=unclassified Variovorax TaxID=663243 RepID=UPI00089D7695|nr:hypothetical protein SAMN03159371_00139 [Variovorax sp. NFACC28]SEF71749.1 hypothetical protein SAMN03159365_00679 [Variovorax sp. NFACC29]SFB76951.1 hypothetical protein SAMN03159379_00678 [Variovorax sp. NFACC26]SFG76575.1 hypothetical protein SAMN03159447_04801 [Variovorax sp. NFACC27]